MSATPASRVRRSSFLAPGKWRRRLSLSSSRRVSQAGMEKVMGGDGALDLVDVEVGQEDPIRRSGKDDGADVLALLKVFQQVGQLLHHRRGEEVRRGIVEQDLQDASSLFYAQVSRC
ncbi:hypothetical protein QOZ06_14605 [Pseudomonas aeruginosa]